VKVENAWRFETLVSCRIITRYHKTEDRDLKVMNVFTLGYRY